MAVNIALNKPAFQQFPYISKNGTDDKFHARNAVDGRRSDLRWDGGQCSFSNGDQTATWWVNLTSVHSIYHITIYFMTDNIAWGIIIYIIYLINSKLSYLLISNGLLILQIWMFRLLVKCIILSFSLIKVLRMPLQTIFGDSLCMSPIQQIGCRGHCVLKTTTSHKIPYLPCSQQPVLCMVNM